MIVHVVGKQHFSGTSRKSGNPYDFWTAYFTYKTHNVEGEKADSINLSSDFASDVVPDRFYNFDFDMSGRLVNVQSVKA